MALTFTVMKFQANTLQEMFNFVHDCYGDQLPSTTSTSTPSPSRNFLDDMKKLGKWVMCFV
jgi:hypothetical protein